MSNGKSVGGVALSGNSNGQQQHYYFKGVELFSPYKLYPAQKMMIAKTIESIDSCQHCLLESPTGSGKTLALLCATLAWQQREYELLNKEMEITMQAAGNDNTSQPPTPSTSTNTGCCSPLTAQSCPPRPFAVSTVGETQRTVVRALPATFGMQSGDDDFKTPKRFKISPMVSPEVLSGSKRPPTQPFSETSTGSSVPAPDNTKYRKVPKIYYGTRTHKQIKQIIRELKKTAYADVRMTILGSRDHTCIHPEVSKERNKNELCQELLPQYNEFKENLNQSKMTCSFYIGSAKNRRMNIKSPWDLEDLRLEGKKKNFCPFYTSKNLADDADIIFCPYNYLIDPMIRKSMNVSVANQILVLDEAHNIEDVARESASLSINDEEIHSLITDFDAQAKQYEGELETAHIKLAEMFSRLHIWLLQKSNNIEDNYILTGIQMVAILKDLEMGPDQFSTFKNYLKIIEKEEEEAEEVKFGNKVKKKASVKNLNLVSNLFLILEFLYNLKFVEDYKICLKKEQVAATVDTSEGNWKSRRRFSSNIKLVTSINFWCLNPAIVFSHIGDKVRTFVLTSGTLAPTDSFESELGVRFPVKLQAPHVISSSQVFISSIGKGPNNINLTATYKNAKTFEFQDELGKLILEVCKNVPHGILFVVPSYNMLETLSNRWQTTNVWSSIEDLKLIFCEPKGLKGNFDDIMKQYMEAIDDCDPESNMRTGAMLMAVCRGKVSEGIDFADNYARAVITVGIPFPNIMDLQVKMKREYNDEFYRRRGLLTGARWYETQAYRALNQALGRCVRHSNDWGAVILIDDRFVSDQRHANNLSKWIRQYYQSATNFHEMITKLKHFIEDRKSSVIQDVSQTSTNESVVELEKRDEIQPTSNYNSGKKSDIVKSSSYFTSRGKLGGTKLVPKSILYFNSK